jgi:hypothetical protein
VFGNVDSVSILPEETGRERVPANLINRGTQPVFRPVLVTANNEMSLALAYPHIEKLAEEPARLSRVPRVRVAQIVMDYLAYGWSPDEMCRQHPYLLPAEAHAAMAYYFDHPTEIEAEIRKEVDDASRDYQAAAQSSLRLRLQAKGLL